MKNLTVIIGLFLAMLGTAQAKVEVQQLTSPGGISAWLVEEHSIPFTALEIRFRGGSALDAPGKRGAISLMMATLEEGAAELDSQGFAAAREALAASFRFNVYDDVTTISARFLTENRSEAMALLKTALHQPNFDQVAVDRVREQVLSIIRSDATDPSDIAGQNFDELVWGGHPYASSRNGTLDSVASLTRADMFDAKAQVFGLDRMYVSAVGDISAEELGILLDELLGDLPATAAPLVDRADYQLETGTTVIDFDTPQSVALFGHQGIERDDPDYMAAYVFERSLRWWWF